MRRLNVRVEYCLLKIVVAYVLACIDVDSGQRFSLVYDKIAAVLEPYLFIKSLFQFALDIIVCEYVRLALIL